MSELQTLVRAAQDAVADESVARRALACLDLTSLGDADTDETVLTLCSRAVNEAGQVAAVCIWDRFIPVAKKVLDNTGVKVATVCNFPYGDPDASGAALQAQGQVAAGADEVDLVLPYVAYKSGDREAALAVVRAVRGSCPEPVRLKVILETGELKTADLIASASQDAIACGADFIKTSTGKAPVGATLEAGAIMLETIARMRGETPRTLGFKPAGGLKTVADAATYFFLADEILGPDWAGPETFRLGASGILTDILNHLGIEQQHSPTTSSY